MYDKVHQSYLCIRQSGPSAWCRKGSTSPLGIEKAKLTETARRIITLPSSFRALMSWIHSHQEAGDSLPSVVALTPTSSCLVECRRVYLTIHQLLASFESVVLRYYSKKVLWQYSSICWLEGHSAYTSTMGKINLTQWSQPVHIQDLHHGTPLKLSCSVAYRLCIPPKFFFPQSIKDAFRYPSSCQKYGENPVFWTNDPEYDLITDKN